MKTVFLLMYEYETATPTLEQVCGLWNLKLPAAKRKAKTGELPIAFFRANESQKSEWMCHIEDLANHIDSQREQAKKNHIAA